MPIFNKATTSPVKTLAPKPMPTQANAITAIFTLPEVSDALIAAARRSVDRANAGLEAANADLRAKAKVNHPRRGFANELTDHPVVAAAREAVANAERDRRAAHEAMAKAIRDREERFHRNVVQCFENAASHLAVAAEALASVVEPMTEVHNLAWRYRLPLPKLLAEVPKLQEAARVLTAMANAGMVSISNTAPIADGDEI